MPPPVHSKGKIITTKIPVSARVCLKRGYKKIEIPPGKYRIMEIWRNEEYWHVQEMSDGYTYRLLPLDANNPYKESRISIWQNDLNDGVYGEEGDEFL